MSVLKRIFLVTISIICISFSFCYAIDENQLSTGTTQSSNTSSLDSTMSINSNNTSQNSTKVSNVSSSSNSSTFSNILNIALIVVGLLLIFLAIAILIKLNS